MPGSAKDLRIKHFDSLSLITEDGLKSDRDKITFLAGFTGLRYQQIIQYTPKQILRMTELALRALSRLDLTADLPKQITLGGKKFNLIDPDKIGIGWHIDWKNCNIKKDPVRLACMFYVDEGYNYSDVDENGNITFPIHSRYELFKQEFPLDLFVRSARFFLGRSLRSTRASMVREISKRKMMERISLGMKLLNPFNGKRVLKRS